MSGAYHASVNVICFESCVLYRSGVTLCCVLWGGGCEVNCKVSDWLTCNSQRTKRTVAFLPAWARKRRNWYYAILVDCTIST